MEHQKEEPSSKKMPKSLASANQLVTLVKYAKASLRVKKEFVNMRIRTVLGILTSMSKEKKREV